MAGKRCVPPTSLGAVHADLGEPAAAAVTALENAVTVRDTRVIDLNEDPHWTVLHKVARLVALLRKLRLDRYRAGLSTIQARWVGALRRNSLRSCNGSCARSCWSNWLCRARSKADAAGYCSR